jgi:hypothetical protein
VRHLANEGYIPDRYRLLSDECGWSAALGVEWRISDSSIKTDLETSVASRRLTGFMSRYLVCAVLLWLVEITFLIAGRR